VPAQNRNNVNLVLFLTNYKAQLLVTCCLTRDPKEALVEDLQEAETDSRVKFGKEL
jgi:hypothetical protein